MHWVKVSGSLISLLSFALAVGCGGAVEAEEVEVELPDGELLPDIIGTQRSAAMYPEAVMVKVNNAYNDFCTGTLIAKRVVMTAAHCIAFNPGGTWTITAPFAGGESIRASRGETMDAFTPPDVTRSNYESKNLLHDIGVVYLDKEFSTVIPLPTLAASPYPAGTYVSAVGRKTADASAGLVLSMRTALAYPTTRESRSYCLRTVRLTGGGDSGGPLFVDGTHIIVGTEALFAQKKDFWTRTDGNAGAWLRSRLP